MKLSDIKGERTIEVLADLIEPIANIALDEKAAKLFKREPVPDGKDPRQVAVKKIKKSLPALLKGHKKDLITIMAAIKDVRPKDYEAELTLSSLLADLTELLTDEEFLAFLS